MVIFSKEMKWRMTSRKPINNVNRKENSLGKGEQVKGWKNESKITSWLVKQHKIIILPLHGTLKV